MAIEIVLAFAVLPFALGYGLGHAGYAAAVFAALAFTVLALQATAGGDGGVMPAFALGLLVSAVPAYLGGRVRERRSATRP